MKRIPHFFLLCIFLASCGTPAAAPQLIVTFTPTLIPETATPQPTNTPEPTATKDPMKDAPLGADGVETIDGKEVFYKLGADGKTHNYDSGFKDPEGNIIWVSSHIKNPTLNGGIPSVDEPGYGLQPAMPIKFLVKNGISAPFIEHVPNPAYSGGQTYSLNAHRALRLRMGITDQLKYNLEIFPDKFEITLHDAFGKEHTINARTSYTIVLVEYKDIETSSDFEVPKKNPTLLSKTIFTDDINNATQNITILVANLKPIDQLSDEEFMNTILYQYGHILVFPDLSQNLWWSDPGKASVATSFSTMSLKGNPSYFKLSDSP